jgi:hypothetical protein
MEFREEITPEMQEEWFGRINNRNNGFYLIETENEFIGMINGRDIDWEKKTTGSGGIFIWDESWWNTFVPVSAAMLLTEISFLLGLEINYIQVLRTNLQAIRFNRSLGYTLMPDQDAVENQQYILTAPAYYAATQKLRAILQHKFGSGFHCLITDPFNDASVNALEIVSRFNEEQKKQLTVQIAGQ